MKIVDFADFSRRRAGAPVATSTPGAVIAFAPQHAVAPAPLPVTDRWAQLHTAGEDVFSHDVPARDFWSDLQLRLAYPTYRFRHH